MRACSECNEANPKQGALWADRGQGVQVHAKTSFQPSTTSVFHLSNWLLTTWHWFRSLKNYCHNILVLGGNRLWNYTSTTFFHLHEKVDCVCIFKAVNISTSLTDNFFISTVNLMEEEQDLLVTVVMEPKNYQLLISRPISVTMCDYLRVFIITHVIHKIFFYVNSNTLLQ